MCSRSVPRARRRKARRIKPSRSVQDPQREMNPRSLLRKLQDDELDLRSKPERALMKAGCWLVTTDQSNKARAYFAYLVSRTVLLKDLWKLRISGSDVMCRTLKGFLATHDFAILKAWALKQWNVVASYESLAEEYDFVNAWCCVASQKLSQVD